MEQLLGTTNEKEQDKKGLAKVIRRENDIVLQPILRDREIAKKTYRKTENEIKLIQDRIRELDMSIDKFQKEDSELKYELNKMQEMKINIEDEAKITEYKKRNVEAKTQDKQQLKNQINQRLQEFEQQLAALQEFENSAMKKVKMLTAMRESMARKASSAMAGTPSKIPYFLLKFLLFSRGKRDQRRAKNQGIIYLRFDKKTLRNRIQIKQFQSFIRRGEISKKQVCEPDSKQFPALGRTERKNQNPLKRTGNSQKRKSGKRQYSDPIQAHSPARNPQKRQSKTKIKQKKLPLKNQKTTSRAKRKRNRKT